MKKYLVELIGTFFLVFTVLTTAHYSVAFAAFAIASILMIMVYAGGYVSGGHYNPAVSLAACLRGALDKGELLKYWLFQLFGAVIAVLLLKLTVGSLQAAFVPVTFSVKGLLIAEFIFTFALCYVVLHTATSKKTAGNSYYGLAIGFTVLVGAITVGGELCAGAFNPAVALAVAVSGITTWGLIVNTIIANLVAAVCAAIVFKATTDEE